MPVENLHRIFPKEREHDIFSMSMKHIAPALRRREHCQVVGHAVFFVERFFHNVIGGKLGSKENAVGPQLDDSLHQAAGSLRDGFQRCFHFVAVTGCDVLLHVRAQFIGSGKRAEDREDHRHLAICFFEE